MFDQLMKEVVHHTFHAEVELGAKKISELSGRTAKAVAAATQSCEDFFSEVKKGAVGSADSRCTASLQKRWVSDGLQKFFLDVDMTSATWETNAVEDPWQNQWGTLRGVLFSGSLVGCKLRGHRGKHDVPLRVRLVKEGNEWKVQGIS